MSALLVTGRVDTRKGEIYRCSCLGWCAEGESHCAVHSESEPVASQSPLRQCFSDDDPLGNLVKELIFGGEMQIVT